MLLDMCHVCSLSESIFREGPARPEEGPDSTPFTLLGLHASRYRGKCVVHAARHVHMCHVCSLSESLYREGPARLEEGPDSTPFTLLGLHASRYRGKCVVHAARHVHMCHVCSLSESLYREGPARLEEGPDSTPFTLLGLHASRYRGKCVVHAARHVHMCHVCSLSESLYREGPARLEEGPDSTSFTLFVISKSHHVETYLVGSARHV